MELRRFITRSSLIIAPFLIISVLVILIDPYQQYCGPEIVDIDRKKANLFKHEDRMVFSNALWKLNEFKNSPKKNIIIGDSRLSRFDESRVRSLTGIELFNFGITGGNFHSLIETFWIADSLVELENVYLQISYRLASTNADWPVLRSPLKVSGSLIHYVTDKRVIASCLDLLRSDKTPGTATLPLDDWERKMEMERSLLRSFVPDTNLVGNLRKVADHCKERGINLTFIAFPSSPDVVELYEQSPHKEQRSAFIQELSELAPVYDLCHSGDTLSSLKNLYRDPLHGTIENNNMLIDRVWGMQTPAVRVWKDGKVQ